LIVASSHYLIEDIFVIRNTLMLNFEKIMHIQLAVVLLKNFLPCWGFEFFSSFDDNDRSWMAYST
tara:strand:- start:3036 stop:3230 length:195 start_codon:yes stop_codon:yes gene_type:complete